MAYNYKISLVIPTYNVEEFVEKAFESVINQTFKNIEIIVVDDCSTDKSLDIIKNYAAIDKRIRILELSENMGTLVARKKGVMLATGDFIMFFDPDDELKPNACEIALNQILKKRVDILEFGTEIVNRGSEECEIPQWLIEFFEPVQNYVYGKDILKRSIDDKEIIWNLWNKIYNADLCRKAFSCIVDEYKIIRYEDFYAFFILAWYAQSYVGISDKLYIYNYGIGGYAKMKSLNFERFNSMILPLNLVIKGLSEFLDNENASPEWENILSRYKEDFFNEIYGELLIIESYEDGIKCLDSFINDYGKDRSLGLLLTRLKEIKVLENRVSELVLENRRLNKLNKKANVALRQVKTGLSFRIGRFITWIPRKLLGRK